MSVYYFQTLEQIYAVILQKEEGVGLGFSIAGGSDSESKAPTVSNTSTLQYPNKFLYAIVDPVSFSFGKTCKWKSKTRVEEMWNYNSNNEVLTNQINHYLCGIFQKCKMQHKLLYTLKTPPTHIYTQEHTHARSHVAERWGSMWETHSNVESNQTT